MYHVVKNMYTIINVCKTKWRVKIYCVSLYLYLCTKQRCIPVVMNEFIFR